MNYSLIRHVCCSAFVHFTQKMIYCFITVVILDHLCPAACSRLSRLSLCDVKQK